MKKLLSVLIIVISIFAFNAYASEVEITNIEVQENKHYTTNLNNPVIDNDSVDFNIKFEDYQQYIIYKITLNNKASIRYQYEVQYGDSFIDYEIVDEENIIDSKSSKDILLKVNYKDEIDESLYVDNLYNVKDNIKLLLQRPEEDVPTGIKGVIEEITDNPKTGLFFNYGLVLILIVSGTIIYIRIKKNSGFKYNILLVLLVLPVIVYAANTKKITIDLNMNIDIIKPTKAIFTWSGDVNTTMKRLAGTSASSSGSSNSIVYVKRSFELIDDSVEVQNTENYDGGPNSYSVNASDYKIYMWYDPNDQTIYYYSDAVRVLYHPMGTSFYTGLPSLQGIDDIKTDILYYASYMFTNSSTNLESVSLDLSNWDMRNVYSINETFDHFGTDTKNVEIIANNWRFENLYTSTYVFKYVGASTEPGTVENIKITADNWVVTGNSYNPTYLDNYGALGEVFYFVGDNSLNATISAKNWNLENQLSLYELFYGTSYTILNNLDFDVSGLKAPVAKTAKKMFIATAQSARTQTSALRNLDFRVNVTDWELPVVESYEEMFMQVAEYEVNSVSIIGLDTWDTSSVTNMWGLFYYFGMNAHEMNFSGYENWDVSNVTNMVYAFAYIGRNSSLSIDLSKWDVSSVTDISAFMSYTGEHGKDVYVNISGFDLTHTGSGSVIYDIGVDADKMTFIANDVKLNPSNFSSLFSSIGTNAKDLIVEMTNYDLSSYSNSWIGQIGYTNNTAKYNLSNWKINGNNIINIVSSASSIELDLSGWEFTNTNISYPISNSINGCNDFKVDMSDWKINANTNYKNILQKLRPTCGSYELIMKNWDFTGFTDISGLFREFKNGGNYVKLDLSNWNTSTITNMSNLFYATFNGFGEADVDLSGWDISNVTNGTDIMTGFITSCGKATLKVKGWNMTKLNQFTNNMSATGINGQEFNLITE